MKKEFNKEINAAFSIGKILPIDTNLVDELEKQAQGIFKDVETMFQHLQSQMFEATVLTKSSFEVYDQTIVKQGEAIETAIDKTKQLIELCVDLDKEFNRLKQSLGLQDAGNIAQQRACGFLLISITPLPQSHVQKTTKIDEKTLQRDSHCLKNKNYSCLLSDYDNKYIIHKMVKRICTKTSMEVRELIDFYEKVEIWFEKWVA
ncbi:23748_t:CDS:2 [Entrophospora sp. SA101]|nr:23748_t:CDS:2 [Entrophospora sp. SA101]